MWFDRDVILKKEVTMFKDVMIGSMRLKLKVKKGLMMLFSVLLHSAVIFGVIVGPLMTTDTDFSEIKVVDVMVLKTPPIPQAIKGTKKPPEGPKPPSVRDIKKPKPETAVAPQNSLIVPIEIPEDDPWDEDEMDFGPDEIGIDDGTGIEGGFKGYDGHDVGTGPIGLDGPISFKTERISVRQARRIKYVKPIYPAHVKRINIRHIAIVVEAKTDVFGNVKTCSVIKGHPLLNSYVVNAIKKWKYEPYLVGGVPKPVVFTVTVNFRLN